MILFLVGLVGVLACRPAPIEYPDSTWGSFDTASSTVDQFLGPNPYEEGDARLSLGIFYEGGFSEEIPIDEVDSFFYIWVQDENGCEDLSEIVIVNVVPITQLFIPNSFTPNNDEHNELFVIKGMNVVTFSIKIFDRWGEQLFESDSIDKYWDGKFNTKKVQQGAYYYNIEVLGEDKQIFEKSGEIKVIY